MVKIKKERTTSETHTEDGEPQEEQSWEDKVKYLCAIARPLATKKLTKRLLKTVKKAAKEKKIRKGVREVTKYIRKNGDPTSKSSGMKVLVVIAGDVSPIDVIAHVPIQCEDNNIPYCYTPSREDLGAACGSKRQTCMVLVENNEPYSENFHECLDGIKDLPKPY